MKRSSQQVAKRILQLPTSTSVNLIAIDGLGGAGKSTLSAAVSDELEQRHKQVSVIHFDDFYLPSSLRPMGVGVDAPIGGNFDWERLRDQVLVPLRQGRTARYARYDWQQDTLAEMHEVQRGGIVIVEGVGSSRRELSQYYDLRVWVDCSSGERLRRGIARDGESSRDRWENDWMPSEERYLAEHRPDLAADLKVSGEG